MGFASAQSYVEFEHSFGNRIQYMYDFVRLRDGNFLTGTMLINPEPDGTYTDYGYCFLKLSHEDASIMDSVFRPDSYTNYFMLEPHPSGDGYLFINEVYDSLTGSNFLKIRRFYDDLIFDEGNEVTVPLIDTCIGGLQHFLLEEKSFIMMSATQQGIPVLQRFDLNGTLLDRTVLPEIASSYYQTRNIKVFNDAPREYVFTRYNPSTEQCSFIVLDSLLQLKDTISFDMYQDPPYQWRPAAENKLESLGRSHYLLASKYTRSMPTDNFYQAGVQITKRDRETHTNEKTVYFPFPVAAYQHLDACSPYVVDMRQTSNGYVYLAFGDLAGYNPFCVVMLDNDLNVLWQRYFLSAEEWNYMWGMKLSDEGWVGMVGSNVMSPHVFALFIHNNYDGVDEQDGIAIRPYMFWPNPVSDQLNFEFSPDVTPKQVELYDLQGRMVRSQANAWQSLNMEGLPTGQYVMKVTLEDGKVFSDKVVKE